MASDFCHQKTTTRSETYLSVSKNQQKKETMNRALIILAVLLGTVLLSQAQTDSPPDSSTDSSSSDSGSESAECCMPDKWEGREILRTISNNFFGNYITRSISNVSFDFTGQRQVYETVKYTNRGAGEYRTKVLWLANDEIYYTINLNTGGCVARRTLSKLVKRCSSESFTVVDADSFYGLGDNTLPVKRMKYQIPGTLATKPTVFGTTTLTKDCVPVVDQKLAVTTNTLDFKVKEYVEVTEGIQSEDVFAIPDECKPHSDDDDDDDDDKRRSAELEDIAGTPEYL